MPLLQWAERATWKSTELCPSDFVLFQAGTSLFFSTSPSHGVPRPSVPAWVSFSCLAPLFSCRIGSQLCNCYLCSAQTIALGGRRSRSSSHQWNYSGNPCGQGWALPTCPASSGPASAVCLPLTSVGLKFIPLAKFLFMLSKRTPIFTERCTQLRSLGWNSSLLQSMW